MPQNHAVTVPSSNHNRAPICGEHTKREMYRALLGPSALPRTTPAGWTDHALRYQKRDPVGDIIRVMHARLATSAGPATVLVFPEMLRSHVIAMSAEMRPLDLVCQRELSNAEQDKGCEVDKLQFALQASPNVGLCLQFLRAAAEYRARLDALEIFCHHFIAGASR
jgi:hypothetical protein